MPSLVEDNSETTLYKEIFIKQCSERWIDLTLNTGGIPSTLQDLKAQQRSGGYVYQKPSNRFIYWRVEDEVLEMVEESLDETLSQNQLRIRFVGSRVVEGISVTETPTSVVILVPTVASVHCFTFPHPLNSTNKQGKTSQSIFHTRNDDNTFDSKTFHVLSSTPSAVVTGASCLNYNNEAVYALAMANACILLVVLHPFTGAATTSILHQEVTGFLSSISFMRVGRDSVQSVSVSMVLHPVGNTLYLFSLEREGQLRVWSCDESTCVTSTTLAESLDAKVLKGQNHKLSKGVNSKGEVILCAHLQGSSVVALQPCIDQGGAMTFTTLARASPPPGLEMVDMAVGGKENVWCAWLTGQELPAVTRLKLPHSDWANVTLSKPAQEVKPSTYLAKDPSQLYLDAIFSSGFFTATDVAKALSIYKSSAVVDMSVDIREQICAIVELEIFSNVGEMVLDDDEYLEISQRCWSRLYSCCIQYLMSGASPTAVFWLTSAQSLVLIKPSGFSLVTDMSPLQVYGLTSFDSKDADFAKILNSLMKVDMDAGVSRLELALHLGESFEEHLSAAAALIPRTPVVEKAVSMLSNDAIQQSLLSLIDELKIPEEYSKPGPDGENYSSEMGVATVVSMFRDFCSLRLELCEKMLLLLEIVKGLAHVWKQSVASLCKSYYLMHWTCVSNIGVETPLIAVFASANPQLLQPSLQDSVLSLAQTLWIKNNSDLLPQHLLQTKQYMYLQALARIVGPNTWSVLFAKGLLETGEAVKAFDVVMSREADVAYYMRAASLFERYRYSDLVIDIAKKAISVANPTPSELETLYSLLFVHELELGRWEAAYSWIGAGARGKDDCLHRLIVEMVGAGRLKELLALPPSPLLPHLERLLSNRARTLPTHSAASYYNLLYAVYITHHNFKKAASIMFEQGLRAENTEIQWKSYGACLNAIMLVDTAHAWIIKPTGSTDPDQDSIEVLETEDVRREFELAGARYNLGNCPIDTNASEVVTLCICNGHFKTAMRLARMCNLSCVTSIETFTASCVGLSEPGAPWQWVRHNEIYDRLVTEDNAKTMAWKILERLIIKYERPNETVLHKACANKLMQLATFLPTWLLNSYKERNAAELLRLYLRHGDLIEAASLAIEYLRAGLGSGKEAYSIQYGLLPKAPPLWLPLNTIDLLLLELKQHKLGSEALALEATLVKYLETAERVSMDKVAV